MCTALFSVSVAKEMTAEELRQLSTWMKNLPCFAGLEVDRGYSLIAEDVRAPIHLHNLLRSGVSQEEAPFQRDN
ncbi:hypothetical protein AnigIFM60653_006019 [Aspergillus niger]|nr:hypothetical protein AnigIFM60653_006019 [Aspergillus niger]